MYASIRLASLIVATFGFAMTITPGSVTAQAPQAASLSGRWVGVLDIVHSDSSVEPDTAVFDLTTSGAVVSGSAGNSPQRLSPISNGVLKGSRASFDVVVRPGTTFHFVLSLQSDLLTGTVTGMPLEAGSHVAITAAQADSSWQPRNPVPHTPDGLYQTIAKLDQQLFDAYNNCDLATLGNLVTDDLEFYHDKTGLAVGKAVFVKSIQENICGRVHRTLMPGTLEVHRLAHYGAAEMGTHRFTHPGVDDEVGEAKFVTLWQNKDGVWKVSRVISYDHGGVAK